MTVNTDNCSDQRRSAAWRRRLALSLGLLIALPAGFAAAAEGEEESESEQATPAVERPAPPQIAASTGPIEEVVVLGRYQSAATDIVSERIESDVPVDFLDAAGISRVGDSDVAAALRRVPGLTLVDNKYVYVRGLGERYSSALLNGALVPSPDLTRNVLPLDIFPTEIIDSLAVQKGYAPELPAAFGGGNVDIRTRSIPEGPVFSIKLNTGWNSASDDGYSYSGGSDDSWGEDDGTRELSRAIVEGIQTYEGSFAPATILNVLRRDGQFHTIDEAEAVNRQLATSLNRKLELKEKSDLPADIEGEITGGYRWYLTDEFEVGFLAVGAYEQEWRNKDRINRRVFNSDTTFSETERTVNAVNLTGALNVGARFTDDHEVSVMGLFLRNSEDDAGTTRSCTNGQFNDCFDPTSPAQERFVDLRFEQRDLEVLQSRGEHKLGDATLERLPEWLKLDFIRDATVTWYYSDATAESDIPNEARVKFFETLDGPGGAVAASFIRNTGTAVEYRFSELEDEVLSYGYDVALPFFGDGWDLELSGGYDYSRKGRSYTQTSLGLGSSSTNFNAISAGTPSAVFTDANILNPANEIEVLLGVGQFGTESYFAGQINDAIYGKFDLLLSDTWRISGGVRWEDFKQVSVPVDLLNFDGQRIPLTAQEIADSTIAEDELYPALALTYIRPGFVADEFQLRFAWSETVARPDLREVSASTYIDPLTEARVRGNPNLRPSELTNYDIRAEWYWNSGDNLTVSLFYKDISMPIETVQGGATEDNILFNFVNAEEAELYGIELEGLKNLGFLSNWLGDWTSAFYLAGNLTLSDSDISIPPGPGVGDVTNDSRRLTQHSKWVANVQLGFDSFDGRHGATLVYNAFGERVFFAGIGGIDDAFEQPFHSLDLVYSFYPTERLTAKLRIRNLLDEELQIEQQGVTVIEQEVGTTVLLDLKWDL